MIERVQIQGGSNGVYVDSKGRHLRTMGDFAPSPGQWVYTNGVTIYGHQTAAQQPFVFTSPGDLVPVVGVSYDGGIFDVSRGRLKLLKNTIGVYGLATHKSFIFAFKEAVKSKYANSSATWGYDKEWWEYNWVNLNTGQQLGHFLTWDANIDDEGNFWTIGGISGTSGFIEIRKNGIVQEKIALAGVLPNVASILRSGTYNGKPLDYDCIRWGGMYIRWLHIYEDGTWEGTIEAISYIHKYTYRPGGSTWDFIFEAYGYKVIGNRPHDINEIELHNGYWVKNIKCRDVSKYDFAKNYLQVPDIDKHFISCDIIDQKGRKICTITGQLNGLTHGGICDCFIPYIKVYKIKDNEYIIYNATITWHLKNGKFTELDYRHPPAAGFQNYTLEKYPSRSQFKRLVHAFLNK